MLEWPWHRKSFNLHHSLVSLTVAWQSHTASAILLTQPPIFIFRLLFQVRNLTSSDTGRLLKLKITSPFQFMATDSRMKKENESSLGKKQGGKWLICKLCESTVSSTIRYSVPTVTYLYILTAWGRECKYTDAESIRPHHATAQNTLGVELYLIFVGGKRGCSEMFGAAPRITLVFAFRV